MGKSDVGGKLRLWGVWPSWAVAVVLAGMWILFRSHFTAPVFFVLDDLSMLMHTEDGRTDWLGGVFAPMSNGFWRPLYRLQFLMAEVWFGRDVRLFGLWAAVQYGAYAGLCGWLFGPVIAGLTKSNHPFLLSMSVAGIVLFHGGSWACWSQLANIPDVLVGAALVGMVILWDRWLVSQDPWTLAGVIGLYGLGLLSKETVIVAPGLLAIWGWVRLGPSRRWIGVVATLAGLALVHGAWIVWLQRQGTSYASTGRILTAPHSVLRQFLDYGTCLWMPFFHVVDWPFVHAATPRWLLHGARFVTALILLGGLISVIRQGPWKVPAGFYLMACLTLLPVSLLVDSPQSRFLVPALGFGAYALVSACLLFSGRVQRGLVAFLVIWGCLHGLAQVTSPTVQNLKKMSSEVQDFMDECQRREQDWPDGSLIAIYDHPHPGPPDARWSYCQLLWNLFLPERKLTICLDSFPPQAHRGYRFREGRLWEVDRAGRELRGLEASRKP